MFEKGVEFFLVVVGGEGWGGGGFLEWNRMEGDGNRKEGGGEARNGYIKRLELRLKAHSGLGPRPGRNSGEEEEEEEEEDEKRKKIGHFLR